ncbi:alpha/beta fold hydrolase [Paractinoplanes brasiliensis]|uniref:Pimeloyl-ACP methyl ester carboxylesterase n=1 Tax=Paractinoplanes brasiliensis TaxID=52695 RepID=A0A4R6JAM7_9ACTN|nr:alpha/beta hydrolase [Actinoplanes brasiliensis]TDO31991.1 pimeloyl-ACP methyl ester carboxylesterase [Actinoplanes brasiliensis]GID28035.1 alpha/beta hydrolase [Actinoplanes brasiliensis]
MSFGKEANLTLSDGRAIDYLDAGDPSGRPIFFQPGSPNTRIMGKLWHPAALVAGVRLISVSRPGYGGSTAIRHQPMLSTVGRDLAELATLLGLDEYAVIGSSGGGPYAVAAAAIDSLRVRAVGVVAGTGPWRELADPSSEPEERAVLALLDRGDLAGARAGMRHLVENVWQADLRRLDGEARLNAWLGDDPLAADEAYRAIMADALSAIVEGTEGVIFDGLAHGAGWDIDLQAVHAPVLLWYGGADESCPVTYGRWYAEQITRANLVVFSEEDHLAVGDSHRPEVLAAVLEAWQ